MNGHDGDTGQSGEKSQLEKTHRHVWLTWELHTGPGALERRYGIMGDQGPVQKSLLF